MVSFFVFSGLPISRVFSSGVLGIRRVFARWLVFRLGLSRNLILNRPRFSAISRQEEEIRFHGTLSELPWASREEMRTVKTFCLQGD